MELFWLIVVLVIAPFVIAKVDAWRKHIFSDVYRWWDEEKMPAELKEGTIFLSESELATQVPIPLHGRVDQVFMNTRNVLIPLDTKSRDAHKVFESDIIQLSVYRLILDKRYQYKVSKYGYVRTVIPGKKGKNEIRYIKTYLMSESQVVRLYKRYQAIKSGRTKPRCTCGGVFH